MAEFFPLGLQVPYVARRGLHLDGKALDDLDSEAAQPENLPRVIGQEPHFRNPEIAQNLRADSIITLVLLEPQLVIRLHGVEPLILQGVRPDLVRKADAPPLL